MHEGNIPVKDFSQLVLCVLFGIPVDGNELEVALESTPQEQQGVVEMAGSVAEALERYQSH